MKEERFRKILDILAEKEYVSVETLSKTLYVSMPTVRRDLNAMQDMGLVSRSHGGVTMRRGETYGGPAVYRMGVNSGEKLKLDRAAALLARDNSMIFMDESTTTLHIIDYLTSYKNITIVTNSISVLQLVSKYGMESICLGGSMSYDTMSAYGSETERMVQNYGIDIMFFSSSALTPRGCIADYCAPANSLRREVLRIADKKVFLCDESKFMKSAAYILAPLKDIDNIIVNAPLPPDMETGNADVTVV